MQRALRQAVAAGITLGALGFAAAAFEIYDKPATGPTLFETLVLLQYGHGALDWPQYEATGERHAK